MLKTLIASCMISFLLISCQKEVSYDLGNNTVTGQGSQGTLLLKMVTHASNDSSITSYQYDNKARLIRETVTGTLSGSDVSSDFIIVRNSSGIITQTIQKSQSLLQTGIDSVVRIVHYDASSGRYTSATQPVSFNGINAFDSTVFIYNSTGQITEEDSYANYSGLNFQVGRLLLSYTNDGKNISSETLFADTSLTTLNLVQVGSVSYTFDNKSSPLVLSNSEAVAMQLEQLFNSNNILQLQENDLVNTSASFTTIQTYTYNSFNKPATGTTLNSLSGTTYTVSYYYQ